MTTAFHGPSWMAGGARLDALREEWETNCFDAAESNAIRGSANPVDAAVMRATEDLRLPWYDAIGNMGVKLGSDASKMRATGEDYATTEDEAEAANNRYWNEV